MPAHPPKRALARRMRKAPSLCESLLWRLLRDRRFENLKFRRQLPIGPYVADFVCLRHHLIIEADGPFHDPVKDAERDAWLRSRGFRVLRFSNGLISSRPGEVLDAIRIATEAPEAPWPDQTWEGWPQEGSFFP